MIASKRCSLNGESWLSVDFSAGDRGLEVVFESVSIIRPVASEYEYIHRHI
jgi:hypothetical protein